MQVESWRPAPSETGCCLHTVCLLPSPRSTCPQAAQPPLLVPARPMATPPAGPPPGAPPAAGPPPGASQPSGSGSALSRARRAPQARPCGADAAASSARISAACHGDAQRHRRQGPIRRPCRRLPGTRSPGVLRGGACLAQRAAWGLGARCSGVPMPHVGCRRRPCLAGGRGGRAAGLHGQQRPGHLPPGAAHGRQPGSHVSRAALPRSACSPPARARTAPRTLAAAACVGCGAPPGARTRCSCSRTHMRLVTGLSRLRPRCTTGA